MDITDYKKTSLFIASFLRFLPSKLYLKILYKYKTGRKLNLKKPLGYSEKLNWLKLNNVDPTLSEYVDKIKVRKIVENRIGSQYLTPIYGSWEHFKDIDFDTLPESFVLKCNHDSGGVRVIKNKSSLTAKDYKALKKFFENRLKHNAYYFAREYPYKSIKPLIYAEKCMVDESNIELKDYKFFCFNGKPELYYIGSNRGKDTRFDFYDMECNHLDIYNCHKNADKPFVGKPPFFDEMVGIATQLSQGFNHVRIDLYSTNDGVFFGEYTFFHTGGLTVFYPLEWERKLGDLISL